MIRDLVIIKDGVPLLAKTLSNSQKGIFAKENDLVMLSGFFSALNSFSDQFENLGSISELQLSKSNFKLSFVKDQSIPNLLYLATFDNNSKGVNVQRYLRKISRTFLKKYNINEITNWAGRVDAFKSFEQIINNYVEDEKEENELHFNEKVVNLFDDVKEKFNESNSIMEVKLESNSKLKEIKSNKIPDYYNVIPTLKISKKIDPSKYLTGDKPLDVLNQINGEKSIEQIAHELKLNQERVYAICKSLIKFGFISF